MGCEKVIKKTLDYQHTLMRNDIYIYYECPKLWHSEYVIPTPDFKIVTDAIFSVKGVQYCLEIDRTQKMKRNIEKINQYARFKEMGIWQKQNMGRFPVLVFYTTKDSRQHNLMEYCKQKQLEHKIYTKEDLI